MDKRSPPLGAQSHTPTFMRTLSQTNFQPWHLFISFRQRQDIFSDGHVWYRKIQIFVLPHYQAVVIRFSRICKAPLLWREGPQVIPDARSSITTVKCPRNPQPVHSPYRSMHIHRSWCPDWGNQIAPPHVFPPLVNIKMGLIKRGGIPPW